MTKQEREQVLREKLQTMQVYERDLRAAGKRCIAGVDEVGRGPLAGPVVAACVVLPEDFDVLGVDDSKKLSEKKREQLYDAILSEALAYGIGMQDNASIDEINILEATKEAMRCAIIEAEQRLREKTGCGIDHILIDALTLREIAIPQTGIIKGDSASLSIALFEPSGADHKRRCKEHFHRCGIDHCQGDQGPDDGRVRQYLSGLCLCEEQGLRYQGTLRGTAGTGDDPDSSKKFFEKF